MTSAQALFYNPPRAYILFPWPELICCLSSRTLTETSSAAAVAAPVSAPSAGIYVPKAGVLLLSRDVGPQVRATAVWALGFFFFFFLPKEQTMISWNNAADERLSKENKALTSWVLKARSWANTLSCYNQASVNFHCRLKGRKTEILLQTLGFDFHHSWRSLIVISHHLTLAVHDRLNVNVRCVGFGDIQWWEYKLQVGNINQRVCCL